VNFEETPGPRGDGPAANLVAATGGADWAPDLAPATYGGAAAGLGVGRRGAPTPAVSAAAASAVSGAAKRPPQGEYDPAADPALRMGGIALKNGLVLVSERNWAAAIREDDGTISVASGPKPHVPGSGGPAREARAPRRAPDGGAYVVVSGAAGASTGTAADADKAVSATGGAGAHLGAARAAARAAAGPRRGASAGVPLLRGLGRFGESLMVLGIVKSRLPNAKLPLEGGRVLAALAASAAATSAVRAAAPKSAFAQETGTALAAFIPAMLAVKNSAISGYHGAEHKVIGGREEALRAAVREEALGARGREAAPGAPTQVGAAAAGAALIGDSAAATKEHDRCGSNLVGPYLLATVATSMLARGRSGQKTPVGSALAGAASLGLALEALRWATKHGDSVLARLMLMPGRAIQKRLTTTEPTTEQLEVGQRALEELLRLEVA
jgi:hypothetical protein